MLNETLHEHHKNQPGEEQRLHMVRAQERRMRRQRREARYAPRYSDGWSARLY